MSAVIEEVTLVEPVGTTSLLVKGVAGKQIRACVTIPVRNEERTLEACLDALAGQMQVDGAPLGRETFEVLLLCNNCTDASAEVARAWGRKHPEMVLHVAERDFGPAEAHAGTARRVLMETAWYRLEGGERAGITAILCTDGDSTVAPDWIAQNLLALEQGADAVGGAIEICPQELRGLPAHVRRCYEADRRYAALVAELEDKLDPQLGDPWPRHLDHFGSSLACTPEAYARAGGMPAAAVLEDEAFVNRLRVANQRLRHAPAVRVRTSARLEGRATKGLAGQFRQWCETPSATEHRVQSAQWLEHRFRTVRALREAFWSRSLDGLVELPQAWQGRVRQWLQVGTVPEFLREVDCDRLIAETFVGHEKEPIGAACAALEAKLADQRAGTRMEAPSVPAGAHLF